MGNFGGWAGGWAAEIDCAARAFRELPNLPAAQPISKTYPKTRSHCLPLPSYYPLFTYIGWVGWVIGRKGSCGKGSELPNLPARLGRRLGRLGNPLLGQLKCHHDPEPERHAQACATVIDSCTLAWPHPHRRPTSQGLASLIQTDQRIAMASLASICTNACLRLKKSSQHTMTSIPVSRKLISLHLIALTSQSKRDTAL